MKRLLNLILLTALLLGLPLAGVIFAGHSALDYLQFPPRTRTVEHAPFSWPVFVGLALFILAAVLPFVVRILKSRNTSPIQRAVRPFPWWGWAGLLFGAAAWLLAWTRFDWFSPLQRHTFILPWIAYIITVNALTFRRTGRCLLTHSTNCFLHLFPLSAAFWWFFEYLNRFVQNWYYTACDDLSGMQYFFAATLPFATVLPAVLSTEECLATCPRMTAGLENFLPVRIKRPRLAAGITFTVSAAGLFLIGWFPDQLFPLLWVAPLLLMISFQTLENQKNGGAASFRGLENSDGKVPNLGKPYRRRLACPPLFGGPENGDWRRVFRLCLAALLCGFFWEMWNMYSLSKWIYTVPYVNRFHVFEMPVLGYSGYLPFGLECAVIAQWLSFCQKNNDRRGAKTRRGHT